MSGPSRLAPGEGAVDPDRWRRNPTLYQVNAVPWVRTVAGIDRPAALDEVPEGALDEIAELGVDLLWLMGVWTKGPVGVRLAREHPAAAAAYAAALPDWGSADVVGSPFALSAYRVSPSLGGEEALAAFRARLAERSVGLVLDFVPNHTSRDHPWVRRHPDRYVTMAPELAEVHPDRYFRADTTRGPRAVAFGKDPHFAGWTDTAQLDWTRPEVHQVMTRELVRISRIADGVRCDMAMLVLGDVFARTWPEVAGASVAATEPYWPRAIAAARAANPHFVTIAEVYWGLERRLLELGFDYAYDKVLYDRLRSGDVASVRAAIESGRDHLTRGVHFIANHDEDPAATAFGEREMAAATLVSTLPGLRFVHESQLDARTVRLPVQLGRNPESGPDRGRIDAYRRLLAAARTSELRDGAFTPAKLAGAEPHEDAPATLIAYAYSLGGRVVVVAVNLGERPLRARVHVAGPPLGRGEVDVVDLLGGSRERVRADDILARGLPVSLDAHAAAILRLGAPERTGAA